MGNRPPKLSKEDLNALLDKTSFSKKQIKHWYKGFMVSNDIIHRARKKESTVFPE